jgi:hypothetical protein
MKTIYLLILVFAFAVLTSCGEKKETGTSKDTGSTENKTSGTTSEPTFEKKTLFNSYNDCKENSDSCSYIKIEYDEMTEGNAKNKINSRINHILLTTMYPMDDSTYGSLDAMMKGFISDYESAKKEFPDIPGNWYLGARMIDTAGTDKILCFKQTFDMFTGGAHGSYYENFYNFNAETGDSIGLSDILKPGFEKELQALVVSKFRKDQKIPEGQSLTEAGLFSDTLSYNDNFLITKEGLTFHYNIYEIWSYAQGTADVFIPYSDLKAILKENGLY